MDIYIQKIYSKNYMIGQLIYYKNYLTIIFKWMNN